MSRIALLILASTSLVVASGCKRESRAEAAPSSIGGGPSPSSSASLLPGATCAFPSRIQKDTTIAAGCVADVVQNVLVENGSTLTIEPGVTLRFGEAAYLEIGHKGSRLVARGTENEPILFTSGAATKRPGDWVGIVFDEDIGEPDSTIEHAVIEYAGRDSHGGRGAITVFTAFPAGRLTIRDVAFRRNNLAAVSDEFDGATFGAFDRVRFENDALAMKVSARVFSQLGNDVDFGGDGVELVGGRIDRPGRFPFVHAPIVVDRPITVAGPSAKLSIAGGDSFRFAKGTWLEVGVGGDGAIDAQSVTFDSAEKSPQAGDWVGILFGPGSNGSRLAECVIDHAGGEDHGGDGAITFVGRPFQGLDVGLYGDVFRDNAQAQVSDGGEGCNKVLDPKNGNAFAGKVEPCY